MTAARTPGTRQHPIRVAVVGAGPAGFFTAEALLRSEAPLFDVDVFERLPTPFGLVRSGVAPDHQKIKAVTKTFERTAAHHRFRFLGNVEVGRDLSAEELGTHYDQVVYAIGSSTDRRLGIPGEELGGCHAATAFVGWYNAHPDFREFPIDLGAERAVVVGAGNVAMDIARVLVKAPEQLAKTDIARHAVEALSLSRVREVVLLARRGPAQAAFDPRELADIAALPGVSVSLDLAAVEADAADPTGLDPRQRKNLELMLELARRPSAPSERRLRLEFNASPIALEGNAHVERVRVERNTAVREPDGRVVARGTGETFDLPAGLVFRSIGYQGEPLVGVPFDSKAGVIPNLDGRVTDGGAVLAGTYAVGWIRRGPLGVIGTNKADAQRVVERMLEDASTLPTREPSTVSHAAIDALLARRGVSVTTYADWLHLDLVEINAGRASGKLREKFASVEAMMNELLARRAAE